MPKATLEITGDTNKVSWGVCLSEHALKFLRKPMKAGSSRLDAYLSLLTSCSTDATSYKPTFGPEITLAPFQIVVVIYELSEQWGWSRETVRKFLDGLIELGLIHRRQLDRCALLTMSVRLLGKAEGMTEDGLFITTALLPDVAELIGQWEDGSISAKELSAKLTDLFPESPESDDKESNHDERALLDTLILWIARMVGQELDNAFQISKSAYQRLILPAYISFNAMWNRDWVCYCTFIDGLRKAVHDLVADAPHLTGNDHLHLIASEWTKSIFKYIDKAMYEASCSDEDKLVDGSPDEAAEAKEEASNDR